jgi:hypothetical protein
MMIMRSPMLLLFTASQLGFTQTPTQQWTLRHRFPNGTETYTESKNERFKGYPVIRVLTNNPVLGNSFVTTFIVDCKNKMAAHTRFILYSKTMAQGDPITQVNSGENNLEFRRFDNFQLPKEINFPALCADVCTLNMKAMNH